MNFGTPSLAAYIADGTAPKLPSGSSWVALPPDALASSRLAAGQVVLIGVTSRVVHPPQALGSPAAGRSPGLNHGPSTFGPALDLMAPEPATGLPPQPQSLWRLCSARLGLPSLADVGWSTSSSSLLLATPGRAGTHLLPARVWPATRLPRSTLLLSPALRETAGQPPAGTVVLLYHPSAAAAAAPGGLATPGSSSATVRDIGASASPGCVAAETNRGGCAIVLQLCGEALLQAPVSPDGNTVPSSRSSSSSSSSSSGTGAGAGTRPPASPISTPAGKGLKTTTTTSVGPGRSPATATPVSRNTGGGGGVSGDRGPGYATAIGPLQQWPLDTLRRAAEAGDEATRSALMAVARRHLAGQHLLEGAPLILPVLGSSVVFCVVATRTPVPAAAAGSSYGHSGSAVVEVRRDTQLVVLYPGERLPEGFEVDGVDGPLGARGAMEGRAAEVGRGPAAGGSVTRRVTMAREAAAAAVSDSSADAAADAAERSLIAGMSAEGADFSQLGGVGQHLCTLRELVSLPLKAPQLFKQYGIRPPRGVLLYGPPGSGKTMLARAAAADAGATVFLINGPDVVSEYYGESESSLRGIFAAASALAPSLVIMDEVDALAPARSGGGSSHHVSTGGSDVASRLVTALLTLLDGAELEDPQSQQQLQPQRPVVVVAATNRPDALDPALRRPGRLEREIEVGVPTAEARVEILEARLRSVRHCLQAREVAALASCAHGFVSADLAALVDEAAMCALRRRVATGAARLQKQQQQEQQKKREEEEEEEGEGEPVVVTLEDFKTAETRIRPSALREVAVEIPSVRWDDIGGLHAVKQALREAVEWPHKAQSAMARLGAQAPRGVLLFGPPGCSKTLLARAVASEARLNFLSVKGGELVSKYVGESEKAIAGLFARARTTAPSIIFFDELDGLVGSRGGAGAVSITSDVNERLLSQLLMEMDGLMDRGRVTVIAATNRPDCLDPALLRPGRFDRLIHVPLPDKDARVEILRVQLRRCPLAEDVDVGLLAMRTAGYSGADLAAVVREAGLAALEEDLAAERVGMRHFEASLQLVQASVVPNPDLMAMYSKMQRAMVSLA